MDPANGKYPRMINESEVFNGTVGKVLRTSDSIYDVAAFCAKFSQSVFSDFASEMIRAFGSNIKVSFKEGILRIAEKLKEIMNEKNVAANESWYHLTDLLRLQVQCKSPQQVMDMLKTIAKFPDGFRVLRFKPRLSTFLSDVTINFSYYNLCCCEL